MTREELWGYIVNNHDARRDGTDRPSASDKREVFCRFVFDLRHSMRKRGIIDPLKDPEECIIHDNTVASKKSKSNKFNKINVVETLMDEQDGKRKEIDDYLQHFYNTGDQSS